MKDYNAVVKSYAWQAPRYDRLWKHYNQATLRVTVEAVPWESLGFALDVGCGTGLLEEVAQRLHPETRLIGVDISPAMLAQARRKLAGVGQAGWVQALAEELPFADGSFDAVVCANSFHYLRRPLRALEEFRRVLRPGGWLVITDWCDDYLACKICDWVLRVLDRAHFRMYGMNQCIELLTRSQFQLDLSQRFKIDWLWGLMTHRARAGVRTDGHQ